MATVGSLDPSHNLQVNYVISFLFCLDLILHACKILIRCDSFEILNFTSKQRGKSKEQQKLDKISSSCNMIGLLTCSKSLSVH